MGSAGDDGVWCEMVELVMETWVEAVLVTVMALAVTAVTGLTVEL